MNDAIGLNHEKNQEIRKQNSQLLKWDGNIADKFIAVQDIFYFEHKFDSYNTKR